MKFRSSASRLALVAGLGMALTGCSKLGEVRAMKAFKDGNKLYAGNDYRGASQKYEEAIEQNPENHIIHFYLANSYDNMYRPTRKGEPTNDGYLTKAVEHYKLAGERIQDPKMQNLSYQYLVAAYGQDKLNDPTMAEPVVQKMIELDPADVANYVVLAKIYEDSGEYELAEKTLQAARTARPSDPAVYVQLSNYYNRQGDFDQAIGMLNQRAQLEPNNPEAHYSIAQAYWDKAYRDARLTDPQKSQFVQDGIKSVDRAIEINGNYMEAITYKNLLLRLQANLEKDPKVQQALLKEANALVDRANELRKAKSATVSD